MGDGAMRFIAASIDRTAWAALASASGGELVTVD
jgi:hypothetical protein